MLWEIRGRRIDRRQVKVRYRAKTAEDAERMSRGDGIEPVFPTYSVAEPLRDLLRERWEEAKGYLGKNWLFLLGQGMGIGLVIIVLTIVWFLIKYA